MAGVQNGSVCQDATECAHRRLHYYRPYMHRINTLTSRQCTAAHYRYTAVTAWAQSCQWPSRCDTGGRTYRVTNSMYAGGGCVRCGTTVLTDMHRGVQPERHMLSHSAVSNCLATDKGPRDVAKGYQSSKMQQACFRAGQNGEVAAAEAATFLHAHTTH